MAEPQNLANAAIIMGTIYFWNIGAISWIACVLLIIFGFTTWTHLHQTADQKKLIRLGIEEIEVRTQNMKMATAVATAKLKVIMRNLQQ